MLFLALLLIICFFLFFLSHVMAYSAAGSGTGNAVIRNMASDTSNSSAFQASLRLSLHAHAEKQASGHDAKR